jgi:hypothetical protein
VLELERVDAGAERARVRRRLGAQTRRRDEERQDEQRAQRAESHRPSRKQRTYRGPISAAAAPRRQAPSQKTDAKVGFPFRSRGQVIRSGHRHAPSRAAARTAPSRRSVHLMPYFSSL